MNVNIYETGQYHTMINGNNRDNGFFALRRNARSRDDFSIVKSNILFDELPQPIDRRPLQQAIQSGAPPPLVDADSAYSTIYYPWIEQLCQYFFHKKILNWNRRERCGFSALLRCCSRQVVTAFIPRDWKTQGAVTAFGFGTVRINMAQFQWYPIFSLDLSP